jgi:CHAT domain-containing protein/tetratricopeptide (TPR) repeat protein
VWIAEGKLGKCHPTTGVVLNNLAGLYKAQGRYGQAEPLLRRCLETLEAVHGREHPDVALALNNLAGLYRDQGRYVRAEGLYRRSLRIREARLGKSHPRLAESLNNLGHLYLCMEKPDRAEPLLERSLKIWEGQGIKGHPRLAHTLINLTWLYTARREWSRAGRTADRALRTLHRHIGQVLPALPEAQRLAFLHANVHRVFHQLLSLGVSRPGDAELADLSAGWVLNYKALAQQTLAESSLLDRARTDPQLADLVEKLVAVRARLARATFARVPAGRSEDYLQYLGRLEQQEDRLARQFYLSRPTDLGPLRWVEVKQLRRALPRKSVLIEMVKFDYRNVTARGEERRLLGPHYAAWIIPPAGEGSVRVVDLGKAGPLEAAVQAVRRGFLDAPQALRRVGERRAAQELAGPLAGLARQVIAPLGKTVKDRRRWFVSPDGPLWLVPWAALPWPDQSPVLEQYEVSYVVSGRDLLPSRSNPRPARDKRSPPLVLADPDFNLDAQEAVALAERFGKTRGAERGGAGRLSAALGPLRWQPLPGTAREARAIAPLLERCAGTKPLVLTGKKALESVCKTVRSPRVLVLSTHGFFLEDQEEALPVLAGLENRGLHLVEVAGAKRPANKVPRPLENPLLRCGLALAGANQGAKVPEGADDGILTGLEIVGTDLRGTELVVLSACDTGLGQVRNGEGVAGLRQAFQLAGAGAVVATLWPIPDRETTELMTAFFENLAAKKGKAEALRRAQMHVIKRRRAQGKAAHPFYWAAFTLTGQWE